MSEPYRMKPEDTRTIDQVLARMLPLPSRPAREFGQEITLAIGKTSPDPEDPAMARLVHEPVVVRAVVEGSFAITRSASSHRGKKAWRYTLWLAPCSHTLVDSYTLANLRKLARALQLLPIDWRSATPQTVTGWSPGLRKQVMEAIATHVPAHH